jgi:hypothetical protein
MNVLREALEFLLGQARPNPLQVTLPPERYVATSKLLEDADLITLQQRLGLYIGEVQPRYSQLVATGWLGRLELIVTAEAGFLIDPKRPEPDPDLPQSAAVDPGRRLRVPPIGSSGAELGFALLAGQRTVGGLNLADARRAVTELRNADNVCIRVLASLQAADLLSLPVSEMLALYRTEGDLQVPVSFGSVRQRVPSTEPRPASSLVDMAQLIRQMVFLNNAMALPTGGLASEARHAALVAWLLQLAGLDHLNARIFPLVGMPSFLPQLVRFSAANAARVPAASSLGGAAGAEQRWKSLFDGLGAGLVRPKPDGSSTVFDLDPEPAVEADDAVLVAPTDPVRFVAGVLAEGAAYLRRLGTADDVLMSNGDTPGLDEPDPQPLPAGHPLRGEFLGAGLAYFRYNLQVGAINDAPYQAGMISAVANAANTQDPDYQALRTAIQQSDKLTGIADQLHFITVTKDAALIKDLYWESHLAPALRDPLHPERARLLAEFIGSATTAHWGSFEQPRGNASRYQQLQNFYGHLEQVTGQPNPP